VHCIMQWPPIPGSMHSYELQLPAPCLYNSIRATPRHIKSLSSSITSLRLLPCRSLPSSSTRLWTAQQHLHCAASLPGKALSQQRSISSVICTQQPSVSAIMYLWQQLLNSGLLLCAFTGDHTGQKVCVQKASVLTTQT
jgi:hypothetical protein